ncbi:IS4 family transposase [Alphaproteobacteria bacterium]|nr:IS4 family transposase [Alphaproteobacteria bacterium]
MFQNLFAPLSEMLERHFPLSKSRLLTFAVLLVGVANCRTVNLSHLASQFPTSAQTSSNYRRLQRFFQKVSLDGDRVAQLIVAMLKLRGPIMLALDRTNWKLGRRDINILTLAIVTNRFRVPLMWSLLDHQGNSDSDQRIALIQRYLDLFGAASIEMLLADREFRGCRWMEFLNKNNVPFIIRLHTKMHLYLEDGSPRCFGTLLRKHRKGQWSGWLNSMPRTEQNKLYFAAKTIKGGELLIVASNRDCKGRALFIYKKRWAIECLFGDTKTRGFNMEDTHMTSKDKLATLLAIIALAMTWAYRCASSTKGRKSIPRKAHGRKQKSWFRTGFDILRNWILYKPDKAIHAWQQSFPKRKPKIKNSI